MKRFAGYTFQNKITTDPKYMNYFRQNVAKKHIIFMNGTVKIVNIKTP